MARVNGAKPNPPPTHTHRFLDDFPKLYAFPPHIYRWYCAHPFHSDATEAFSSSNPSKFFSVWQIFVIIMGPLSSGISITWWGEWEVISSPKRPTTKVTSSPKSRKSPEKLSTCGEAGPLGGCWSLLGVVSQQLVAELWLANTSEFISLHMKFSFMEAW